VTRSQLQLRARSGKRAELLTKLDRREVFVALQNQPGFLAASVLVPEDNGDDVLVEGSWSSAEHFERWRAGAERAEWLRSLQHLLAAEPVVRVYHVVDAIS
jgi:heme-degrading monooxygenase HmoA